MVALVGGASGCSSNPYVWASEIPRERARPTAEAKEIGRGDVIALSVVGQTALSSTYTVGADGTITVPDAGIVAVAGLTAQQAAVAVTTKLATILQDPRVSVIVVTRFIEVSLLGEVKSPGKYSVQSGDGVANAIALAGGLTEFADDTSIFLIRAGEPVRIRFRFNDLLRDGNSARAFLLKDGDILLVE
jgi:polysaccharide export outer membrane protein